MSWRENIDTSISIVCGDGNTYTPLYRISPRSKDYNTSEFDFPGIKGTYVDRRQPRGYTQTVDLIFQGADHLIEYQEFIRSADDLRPWAVYHPMFGNIDVQPKRVEEDPTGLGLTEVRVQWMETILQIGPITKIDAKDKVQFDALALEETNAQAFENNLNTPNAQEKVQMQTNLDAAYTLSQKEISNDIEAAAYFDLYTKASSKINEGIDKGAILASTIIRVLAYPAIFTTGIKERLLLLKRQFLSISDRFDQYNNLGEKVVYETNAVAIVTAMANAAVTNTNGQQLGSASEIIEASGILTNTYDSLIANLETLQTPLAGTPTSYTPDTNVISALDALINLAASQLFIVALDARQERVVILTEDTNLLQLTHKYYGLNPLDDSKINEFMDQNNIGPNEILQIKKGRRIVYYV
jgi:hypothetical protein